MRIIFIRHAEPDYRTDSLTELGRQEAAALAERTKSWKLDRIYCSPLGRARETAQPTLDALHMEPVIYPWLREFSYQLTDPLTGEKHVPWDLMPQYFTSIPLMYDKDRWYEAPIYRENPAIEEGWHQVSAGIDSIVKAYGYTRKDRYYQFEEPDGSTLPAELSDVMLHGTSDYQLRDADDEKTIAIFCHLGVTCVMLAHLIGVSPVLLWQGTCIPASSITIVNAEKRLHNASFFRIQALGDCAHLLAAGVPISGFASFAPLFQQ